jgi:phage baseplate assembly protein W
LSAQFDGAKYAMPYEAIHALHYPPRVGAEAGRLLEVVDYELYIRQLIHQVLFTAPGERVNRPNFGAGIARMVFGPSNPATASLARTLIYEAMTSWLSSYIRVENVQVQPVDERLNIELEYILIARGERKILNVEVQVG